MNNKVEIYRERYWKKNDGKRQRQRELFTREWNKSECLCVCVRLRCKLEGGEINRNHSSCNRSQIPSRENFVELSRGWRPTPEANY